MKKSNPMRRCVGCMQSYPQEQLIRLTLRSGSLLIDDGARAEGRGLYLCRNEECIRQAVRRKSFNRACRCTLDSGMLTQLTEELIKEVKNVKES